MEDLERGPSQAAQQMQQMSVNPPRAGYGGPQPPSSGPPPPHSYPPPAYQVPLRKLSFTHGQPYSVFWHIQSRRNKMLTINYVAGSGKMSGSVSHICPPSAQCQSYNAVQCISREMPPDIKLQLTDHSSCKVDQGYCLQTLSCSL